MQQVAPESLEAFRGLTVEVFWKSIFSFAALRAEGQNCFLALRAGVFGEESVRFFEMIIWSMKTRDKNESPRIHGPKDKGTVGMELIKAGCS